MSLINTILIFTLELIRPLLGPISCKYDITCGNYAIQELKSKKVAPAIWSITKRLFSCNPFNRFPQL